VPDTEADPALIVAVDPHHPGAAASRAVDALRAGEVVALPTDTVYGLAALPTIKRATDRLFALKGRATDVPIAVLCSDAAQALGLAAPGALTDEVRRIAERLWPGPLTLVLPGVPGLGYELGEPTDTVGVRCPNHELVRTIAATVGPIATTSANRHREPPSPTAEGVAATFGAGLALVLDGGRCAAPPSTVVAVTGTGWSVLRQGSVSLAQVAAAARR
jgi:tRNA threonylcarbamoyl adenosine modification protein (Sua5/YciO/YrdC/YwlC family)